MYLHWPSVSVKKKQTLQQDKCKKFVLVSVNDLHLHEIYMPYIQLAIDTYMHNTGSYVVGRIRENYESYKVTQLWFI